MQLDSMNTGLIIRATEVLKKKYPEFVNDTKSLWTKGYSEKVMSKMLYDLAKEYYGI